ncbi:MAG: hypothetical protein JW779_08335 [Candidatus Thorarchaeota archaeon]|nr:hypothetical protein [Candidatus Thorarchaeota archaeon]
MERRKMVSISVGVIVVVGLVVFVGIPLVQTHFHYECAYPAGSTKHAVLFLRALRAPSTNVTITFVDNPNLLYSIDVVQYEPGMHHHYSLYEPSYDPDAYHLVLDGMGDYKIASIDVILGTATYYQVFIDGRNLNVTLIYDNGAELAGQDVKISTNEGICNIIFTENVNFTDTGLNVELSFFTILNVFVDLPEGMNGKLSVPHDVNFGYTEMVGWSLTDSGLDKPNVFSTSSTDEPLLAINFAASRDQYAFGSLHD